MRSTLKPLLSLASHLQVIARGGIYQGFFRDLSLINHPCYLGYKGEVGYMYCNPTAHAPRVESGFSVRGLVPQTTLQQLQGLFEITFD